MPLTHLKFPVPDPSTRRNLPGAGTRGIPLCARVSRQDSNCEVWADIFDPTALANRTEPESDRFIEGFGCDFGAVLDSFGIADGDAA
jgi:hypothetical protein